MRHVGLFILLLLFPVTVIPGEAGPGGEGLLRVAALLRADQVRVKDLSLRIVEHLLGAAEDLAPGERASLESVNRRLTAVGTVASYEASRLEMLSYIRDEHRPRFARRLVEELKATADALSLDEEMIRYNSERWSPGVQVRIGSPEEGVAAVRRNLEAAIPELKKLGGQTI